MKVQDHVTVMEHGRAGPSTAASYQWSGGTDVVVLERHAGIRQRWLHWSLRWYRGHHTPFAPELAQKHRVFRRLLRRVRAASPRALSACLLGSFSDTRAIWV